LTSYTRTLVALKREDSCLQEYPHEIDYRLTMEFLSAIFSEAISLDSKHSDIPRQLLQDILTAYGTLGRPALSLSRKLAGSV